MPGRTMSPARRSTSAASAAGLAHPVDDLGRLHPRLVPPRRRMPVSAYGGRAMCVGHRANWADRALHHPALELLVAALVLAPAAAPAQVVRARRRRETRHGGQARASPPFPYRADGSAWPPLRFSRASLRLDAGASLGAELMARHGRRFASAT